MVKADGQTKVLANFEPLIDHLVDEARDSLARTPELLPVLRKAGTSRAT